MEGSIQQENNKNKGLRPKITLQIPGYNDIQNIQTSTPYMHTGLPPGTAATSIGQPQFPTYPDYMYPQKASEFMFKQFEGFKDFTMNTAKSGLSFGEKYSFWMFNKFSKWSRNWFTHLFLTFVVLLYSLGGAFIFIHIEGKYFAFIIFFFIRFSIQFNSIHMI